MTFFRKMCASGNDFIIIDERTSNDGGWTKDIIKKICNRKYGVGADQLLLLRESLIADVQMIIYNADGSRAQQCGNGLRATTSYLLRSNNLGQTSVTIQVGDHNFLHTCHMLSGDVFMVNMGWPVAISLDNDFQKKYLFQTPMRVKIGNDHLIVWVDDLAILSLETEGPDLQRHFNEPINIHFVKRVNSYEIKMRHWEYGVGETLSCGSGTVSAVFAGKELGFLEDEVLVRLAQEELFVEKNTDGYSLKGRVYSVFDGKLRLK